MFVSTFKRENVLPCSSDLRTIPEELAANAIPLNTRCCLSLLCTLIALNILGAVLYVLSWSKCDLKFNIALAVFLPV